MTMAIAQSCGTPKVSSLLPPVRRRASCVVVTNEWVDLNPREWHDVGATALYQRFADDWDRVFLGSWPSAAVYRGPLSTSRWTRQRERPRSARICSSVRSTTC